MKKIFIIIVLFSFAFAGCEKDDICPEEAPTTPQVVIQFFDNASTASKAVTELKILEYGTTNVLGVFNEALIKLPLKTNEDVVKYSLILNSDKPLFINTDYLEFNYSTNTVYISRACGYKSLFELINNSPILTDNIVPVDYWIKNITVVTNKILDENETHIKIYF